MRSNRPLSVTLTALIVLIFTVFFITRFVQAIKSWDFLASLDSTVSPLYLVITGLLFGLSGVPLVFGLWVGAYWAFRGVQIYTVAGIIYYWVDRLLFSNPAFRAGNSPFVVGFTICILITLFWILSRPGVRAYFTTDMEK